MEDCKNEGILSQIKSKCIFNNLKSDYFLKKYLIFYKKRNHLKLLNIIKTKKTKFKFKY